MAYERKHLVISAIAGVLLAGLIIAGTILLPYIFGTITPPTEITSIPEIPPEITTPPPTTEKMGTLVLMLTDAPPRDLEELYITIDEVRLRMVGDGDDEGPILSFPLDVAKEYEITALEGVFEEIGINSVNEGSYTAIWLHISEAGAIFEDSNERVPLKVVAQGWLKIPVRFEVVEGGLTLVGLDFDLEATHISEGMVLMPVIKPKLVTIVYEE